MTRTNVQVCSVNEISYKTASKKNKQKLNVIMRKILVDNTRGLELSSKDDFFLNLIINNYTVVEGEVKGICDEHGVLSVTVKGEVDDLLFKELPSIASLIINNADKFDYSSLCLLKNLHMLRIGDEHNPKIQFEDFPKLEELIIHWSSKLIFKNALSLRWLRLIKFKGVFKELDLPNSLQCLEFIQGNIKSLAGLSRYSNIKMLSICHQRQLDTFEEIGRMKNLEFLNFTSCGKLEDLTFLSDLKSLKYLVLENCRNVKSIDCVRKIKGLKGIRLIGNTSPIEYKNRDNFLLLDHYIRYPYLSVSARLYDKITYSIR